MGWTPLPGGIALVLHNIWREDIPGNRHRLGEAEASWRPSGRVRGVGQVLRFLKQQCIVAMEACGSSHYREIAKLGHVVGLLPPIYVKRQKNDAAEAIAEAARRCEP